MSKEEAIIPAGTYHSTKFEFVNDKLRQHVKLANDEIDNVKDKVNELVTITYNDNKDWSLKKICAYIAGRNDDLEEYGFSARTIHNYLNEENRQLVDKRQQRKPKEYQSSKLLEELRQQKGTIEQNNVTEQSGESLHPTVLEESSITNEYDVNEAETFTENDDDEEGEETTVKDDAQKVDEVVDEIYDGMSTYAEEQIPKENLAPDLQSDRIDHLIDRHLEVIIDNYKQLWIEVNRMIRKVREENPEWQLDKIISIISAYHEEQAEYIPFNKVVIKKHLDTENKGLFGIFKKDKPIQDMKSIEDMR